MVDRSDKCATRDLLVTVRIDAVANERSPMLFSGIELLVAFAFALRDETAAAGREPVGEAR
jgi:hypothetical protein